MKRPTTEQIQKDAEIAATYWVALVKNGVDPHAAASMTAMYLAGVKAQDDVIPGDEWKGS